MDTPIKPSEEVTMEEVIQLGAVDTTFFGKAFFPKTFRMNPPVFHRKVDQLLDSQYRLVSLQMFRGSAKTSKLRVYMAKRIAYGLAHTILCIGISQDKAIASTRWLKKQIEHNKFFTDTFKLRKGNKWQDVEFEIYHGVDEYPITVLAYGVTGPIRGVNIDDYRPDLIILDDILDEENTATEMQRDKMEKLIYGALKESLAPRSEAPDAKMVMLQTPLHSLDASEKAKKDSEWGTARFGCWTTETENEPLEQRESVWEERFPTEELRENKKNSLARNQLSIFTREMECKLTNPELNAFRPNWITYYDILPEDLYCVLAIDPVPPPSELELSKGLKGKDQEALVVVGKKGKDYYLCDYVLKTGHAPNWTVAEFFSLARKWQIKRVVVESIAYQRTLAWLIKKAMDHQGVYYPMIEYVDKRKKYTRILDALSGIASNGRFHIKREHSDFIMQFCDYPNVSHDDLLDATSIAISEINTHSGEVESFAKLLESEKDLPRISYKRGAP